MPRMLQWVMAVLNEPLVDVCTVVKTPWSKVLKINTCSQVVYLKQTPKLIGLEAEIIQLLRDRFQAAVPAIIAYNAELNCFLMKDAGISLRSILKQKFDTDLIVKAIEQFTSLQIAVADHVNVLLDIGVPDWRLDKLPNLYEQAILRRDLLIADGLSEVEINDLAAACQKISDLCQKLSSYSIKQTIVQPDFSDNNTLIDHKSATITTIDLGEISISHPFFSLLNCLQQVKKHYELNENDNSYHKIKNACLKNYMNFESEKNLLNALKIAQVLWYVYGLLAHERLMQACGQEKMIAFQRGKLSKMLKELIAMCKS